MENTIARLRLASSVFDKVGDEMGDEAGCYEMGITGDAIILYTPSLRIKTPVAPSDQQQWSVYFQSSMYFLTVLDQTRVFRPGAAYGEKNPWMYSPAQQQNEHIGGIWPEDEEAIFNGCTVPTPELDARDLAGQAKFAMGAALAPHAGSWGGRDRAGVHGEYIIGCNKGETRYAHVGTQISGRPHDIYPEFLSALYHAILVYEPSAVRFGPLKSGSEAYVAAYLRGAAGEEIEISTVATESKDHGAPATEGEPIIIELAPFQARESPLRLRFQNGAAYGDTGVQHTSFWVRTANSVDGTEIFLPDNRLREALLTFTGQTFKLWISRDRSYLQILEEGNRKSTTIWLHGKR